MMNSERWKRVIESAVEHGYKVPAEIAPQYSVNGWYESMAYFTDRIIFSHGFAKAFWGEGSYKYFVQDHVWRDGKHYMIVAGVGSKIEVSKEEYDKNIEQAKQDSLDAFNNNLHRSYKSYSKDVKEYSWQYHLQQMVLDEDRLSYLERDL